MARTAGDDPRAEAILRLEKKLGFWLELTGNHTEIVFRGSHKKMRVDATICEVSMWNLLVEKETQQG